MTHVYDWLAAPSQNAEEKAAKEWLDKFTRPAYDKYVSGLYDWLAERELSVEWRGQRYICSGASRLGDVWLKSPGSKSYYDHRVPVDELSNWQTKLVTPQAAFA